MLAAFVLCVVIGAEDPKWLDAFAFAAAREARENLADATESLKAAKNGRVNPRANSTRDKAVFRTAEEKKIAIKQAEAEIEQCKAILSGISDMPRLPSRQPLPTDFGKLHGFVVVKQIVDEGSAIVDVITEIYGVEKYAAWLEINTTGWVDDKSYRISNPLVILGTKQYDTAVGGTRTVMHVKALTDAEGKRFLELVKKKAGELEKAKK